ncbi:MAG: DUF6441 family protein [Bacteroidota bacterium]
MAEKISITASVTGSADEQVGEMKRRLARAVTIGVTAATEGLKTAMRRQLALGMSGVNADKLVRSRVYPGGGRTSIGAAGMVYPAGQNAERLIAQHHEGTVIVPKNGGRYLAIPTGYNKKNGWRKSGDGPLITAKQMASMNGWTFTRPTADGRGLVWFIKVTQAQRRGRNGRVTNMAFAGGMFLGGRINGDLGSGRGRRVSGILEAGAVPMFILVPFARMPKVLDFHALAREWASRVPDLIAAADQG